MPVGDARVGAVQPCDGTDSTHDRGTGAPPGTGREVDTVVLLEIVLAGAASLAAGEGTLVVALTSVDTEMAGKVAAGGEAAVADLTDVFLLGCGWRKRAHVGRKGAGHMRRAGTRGTRSYGC